MRERAHRMRTTKTQMLTLLEGLELERLCSPSAIGDLSVGSMVLGQMYYVLSTLAVCTAATLVPSSPCHGTKGTCQASICVRRFFYDDPSRERTVFCREAFG